MLLDCYAREWSENKYLHIYNWILFFYEYNFEPLISLFFLTFEKKRDYHCKGRCVRKITKKTNKIKSCSLQIIYCIILGLVFYLTERTDTKHLSSSCGCSICLSSSVFVFVSFFRFLSLSSSSLKNMFR